MTEVRRHASWMTLFDERLLEALAGGRAKNPDELSRFMADLAVPVQCATTNVVAHLDDLERAGLVRSGLGGAYELTDQGDAYLGGELDAGLLPHPGDITDETHESDDSNPRIIE